MKQQLIIFLTVSLITSLQVGAQNCIDTVHVKGYYIIKKKANEIGPRTTRKKDVTVLEQPVDVHYDPSFIPCDSITEKHPLSYWLNHFFDDTKQVFISCEKFGIKYFITKECLSEVENKNDSCSFPELKSKVLYQTTDLNTGDVFEIYYIDAYWAKVKVKKDSPEAEIVPSKIAQRCISPSVNEFDLYCFVSSDKVESNPKIKDPHIKVWKK
jgi:hypothetical protein